MAGNRTLGRLGEDPILHVTSYGMTAGGGQAFPRVPSIRIERCSLTGSKGKERVTPYCIVVYRKKHHLHCRSQIWFIDVGKGPLEGGEDYSRIH